jgi:hypothetical protein
LNPLNPGLSGVVVVVMKFTVTLGEVAAAFGENLGAPFCYKQRIHAQQ